MSQKRKIGIGICGLADSLIKKEILYDSEEARKLALDLVAFINFESKIASYKLAKTRGPFGAMTLPLENKYLETPSFLEKKYGHLETQYVASESWRKLAEKIRSAKMLRNASTIAVPPTGRSALIIDASTGIEPIFSGRDYLSLHPTLEERHYKFLQTAKNVTAQAHLLMAAAVQKGVDESISKTINLRPETTTEEIKEIYLTAWQLGLKGVSVYREGSKRTQPKHLS